MELRDYLEIGTKKAGSLTALGKILDMSQPRMSHCKAHKERLPIEAVVKLADYIQCDLKGLIAANELVTEKKPEKRQFWPPFVEGAKAAMIALALTIASVVTFLSPTPANAAPIKAMVSERLCIMLNRIRHHLKQRQLSRRFQNLQKSLVARFAARPYEMEPI